MPSNSSSQLDGIMARYLQQTAGGAFPDREELIGRHPDFAEQLRSFFLHYDGIRGASDSTTAEPTSPPSPSDSESATIAPFAPSPLTSTDEMPRNFGDYELLEEIARGGMGVVYRARQVSLNRIVALKTILAGQFAGEEETRRFQREAEAAATLNHSGIVPIYDIGQHGGEHYFAMKLIEGRALSDASPELRQDSERAADLVARLADAIHHAHQRGILHRDLKPANVLIDADGSPVVTDFGLARRTESDQQLTQTGAVVGTPGFMSPEQAAGQGVTTATDVYSLGAILYEMLCGRPPHVKESVIDTLMAVINDDPTNPRELNPCIDRDLELICLKCLAKGPLDRYASASELAEDLRSYLSGSPLRVRAPSPLELLRMWLNRNYGNVIWVPVIALVVGGMGGFALWAGTLGEDLSYKVRSYDNFFPTADRPLLVLNWSPFQNYSIPFVLVTMTTMGWMTAKLVRTKTRAADLGAGLSVGLLAGLLAFAAGIGPLFSRTVLMNSDHDLAWLSQLAAGRTEPIHEEILERYPLLSTTDPSRRAMVLAEKILGDQISGNLVGTWIGVFVCLTLYGLLGLSQTVIAGSLTRNKSTASGLFSYSCFTLSCTALLFIVGAEFALWLTIGSGFILKWTVPLTCIAMAAVAIYCVVRQQRWAFQLGSTLACLSLFSVFLQQNFYRMPPPQIARARWTIASARRSSEASPGQRELAMRLTRAHRDYGRLLLDRGWYSEALAEFQQAIHVIRNDKEVGDFDSAEKALHSNLLRLAGYAALQAESFDSAAQSLGQQIELYQPSGQTEARYVSALAAASRDHELIELVGRGTTSDINTWWRTARLLRVAAEFQGDRGVGNPPGEQWFDNIVQSVISASAGSWNAARKARMRGWLLSRQPWRVFGPFAASGKATDDVDRLIGPEDSLIAGDGVNQPDRLLTTYTGLPVNLRRDLSEQDNCVAYARTRFEMNRAGQVTFLVGSDDGVKVWIDGEVVHRNAIHRPLKEREDRFDVELAAGSHTMLVKITQGNQSWAFALDAVDEEGWPIPLWGN